MNFKQICYLSIILIIGSVTTLRSQTQWYNAELFPLLGKASEETETRYERLPASLKEVSRPFGTWGRIHRDWHSAFAATAHRSLPDGVCLKM
jgi:hypothetical protein